MNSHPIPPKLQGQLLLADPSLRDGNFNKSVILLAEHSTTEGAFGLILNHPSGQTVGDLLGETDFQALAHLPVHLGGPVSRDQLTFAAFWTRDSQFGYAARISAEEAKAYQNQPGTLVRAFAGYSGWAENQLEDELEHNSWTLTSPSPALLELPHDITLWQAILSGISPYHSILARAPDEILAN